MNQLVSNVLAFIYYPQFMSLLHKRIEINEANQYFFSFQIKSIKFAMIARKLSYKKSISHERTTEKRLILSLANTKQ
jgi:hypothetical protein